LLQCFRRAGYGVRLDMGMESRRLGQPAQDAAKANPWVDPLSIPLWLSLAMWVISFFLPAFRSSDWGAEKIMPGWEAFYTAIVLFFVPVKGTLLTLEPHVASVITNFFMLAAPLEVGRARRCQARVYSIFFLLASAIPVGLTFIGGTFLLGFYFWTFSITVSAAWFMWASWRKWFAVLPSVLLAAGLLSLPSREQREELHALIDRLEIELDAMRATGSEPSLANPTLNYQTVDITRNRAASAELNLALVYTQNAAACKGRERISDQRLLDMYPGLRLQAPEPDQDPRKTNGAASPALCGGDIAGQKPWVDERDLVKDSERRGRSHLANAEILLGFKSGTVREPEPQSAYEKQSLAR
jgi:hypothetical protein